MRAGRARIDPELTRERILEVAEGLFRSIGYQKTTVADIAAELGMSAANVYRFFPSKAAINGAICGRVCDGMVEAARRAAAGPGSAADRLERSLVDLHRHARATLLREKRVHDMVAAALEEDWPAIKANIERIADVYESVIREGVLSGEFAVEDPRGAALCLKAGYMGLVHPTMLEQCMSDDDIDARAQGLARFLVRALRPVRD